MDLDPAGTKESTDAELMAGLAAGEDLALSLLMHRWRDRVASFLHKMTGHPDIAADLVQETFVKLYLARNRYRPAGKFSTYLFAIAANLGRNQARWHARHPTVSLDMPRDQAGAVPEPAAAGPSLRRRPQLPQGSARRAHYQTQYCQALPHTWGFRPRTWRTQRQTEAQNRDPVAADHSKSVGRAGKTAVVQP